MKSLYIQPLTLKRFFIYSFAVHAVIAAIIFVIHPAKTRNAGEEFYADLVSPEELLPKKKPLIIPMPKVMRPPPSRPRAVAPPPAIHSGKSQPEKESSEGIRKIPPGEIENGKTGPSPSQDKIAPGGITGEIKPGPSMGEIIVKTNNIVPNLFDKKIIGDLAARDIEKEDKKIYKGRPIALDTKEYKFWNYNQRLKERIESVWHYPDEAAQKGIYGDLVIKFTITKKGQLEAAELIRGSGYPILDNAALEALKEATPYWPLPEEWHMEAYTIEGNFTYTFNRSFIR
jgi:periplasmic protein TonB